MTATRLEAQICKPVSSFFFHQSCRTRSKLCYNYCLHLTVQSTGLPPGIRHVTLRHRVSLLGSQNWELACYLMNIGASMMRTERVMCEWQNLHSTRLLDLVQRSALRQNLWCVCWSVNSFFSCYSTCYRSISFIFLTSLLGFQFSLIILTSFFNRQLKLLIKGEGQRLLLRSHFSQFFTDGYPIVFPKSSQLIDQSEHSFLFFSVVISPASLAIFLIWMNDGKFANAWIFVQIFNCL